MRKSNHFYLLHLRKIAAIFLLVLIIFSGCRSTKYVTEGEYLLDHIDITSDNNDVKNADIKPYIKQKPNSKFVGLFKFHLWIYNRASKNGDGKLHKALQKIGEAPVIYNVNTTTQSEREIKRYLANKGFTAAEVESTTQLNKKQKKATVSYKINCKTPYRIAICDVEIKDSAIAKIVESEASQSLLKKGNRFDLDVLNSERERISSSLKNKGYFDFNKNNFYFEVDTTLGHYQVSQTLVLQTDSAQPEKHYQPSHINAIRFIVGYDTEKALKQGQAYMDNMIKVMYKDICFMTDGKAKIKPEILYRNNLLKPGMLYNKSLNDKTHSMLSAISIIRYVNISYKKLDNNLLDCDVYITIGEPQSTKIELEGTNISGNLGVATNIGYAHKNLFHGAEQLSTNFTVGVEAIVGGDDNNKIGYSNELGADVKLTYPKFMFPFLHEDFKQKSRAKTNFGISYDYQERPEYTRQIATAEMSYDWQTNKRIKQEITPIMMNYIIIPHMSTKFSDYINKTDYLKYSYRNHVILGSRYSITFQGNKKDKKDTRYVRLMVESSGNMLNIYDKISNRNPINVYDDTDAFEESYHTFLGVKYSQYVKFDATGVFSHHINSSNAMAYRAQIGIGIPYNNSSQLPFEKRYFGGGANGVRAWMVRSLGPGTYYNDEVDYWNQSGDINFVASAEYRFRLFWLFDGALFTDIGNTWTIEDYDSQPGAVFKFDTFYRQIAAGVGGGIRLDLNFFVFRVDVGFKAFDPTETYKQRWVLGKDLNPTTHIAIGYPF